MTDEVISPGSGEEMPVSPRIWLVISNKPGDNAQVKILADALGLPYETRQVLPKDRYVLGKPRFKPSLHHLDMQRSDKLEPPWPDLIITIGRRSSMAALWIREQAGPQTKIVLIGRPRRWIKRFNLALIPPQYRVPAFPNVIQLQFPLMRPDKQRVRAAGEAWKSRFAGMPRPLVAVLVGGPTRPMIFDRHVVQKLLNDCAGIAQGGTLFFTTSRRTPTSVITALQENLPDNAKLFIWSHKQTDNPYLALLGSADNFVVTGDSISMMVEVTCVNKPLYIFKLPETRLGRVWKYVQAQLLPTGEIADSFSALNWLGLFLHRLGIVGFPRDLTRFHDYLIDQSLASEPGTAAPHRKGNIPDELAIVGQRVLALLEQDATSDQRSKRPRGL